MSQITHDKDIFSFVKTQEAQYKQPIALNDVWNWSMSEHIKTTFLYIHSQLMSGKSDFKPVKNIIRPILNLQHRTEDIEVKDVQLYVTDAEKYHLSFLVKKYHDDVFVVENDMDTFFDELNVQRIDYGAGLSKKLYKPRPEVVDLQSIAFCDQTDLLSGQIGIKHFYSPDQLLDMESVGWGKSSNGATVSLKELIELSREEKKTVNGQDVKTPGKYIEVYEVHGNVPKRFANPSDTSGLYESRIFIVSFYQKKKSTEQSGVILYTALEKESPFKLTKRDTVYGRALGFGGAEELFDAQVWTNYDEIRKQDMLDAASKTIVGVSGADSASIAQRSKIKDMDNLEMLDLGADGNVRQIDTFPRNMALFDKSVADWDIHAKNMGAAQDPLQGKEAASGTPFSSVAVQIQQGMGLHDYRRGQFAKHIEEIYKDWIIPHIQKEIVKGAEFLSELNAEDLQYVTEAVVNSEANNRVKMMVLAGLTPNQEQIDLFRQAIRDDFQKKGSKLFIEILKGEFKGVDVGVKVSVAGKSKDLSRMTDKLANIFRQIIVNPAMLQVPSIAKLFNQILESSGLDQMDFSGDAQKLQQIAPQAPQATQPVPVAA